MSERRSVTLKIEPVPERFAEVMPSARSRPDFMCASASE